MVSNLLDLLPRASGVPHNVHGANGDALEGAADLGGHRHRPLALFAFRYGTAFIVLTITVTTISSALTTTTTTTTQSNGYMK